VQQAPNQVGVQAGAVWITGQDRLLRLDQEGRVVSAFELGRADGALIGGGHDVAFGEGAVWVTCSCGSEPDPRFGSTSGGVVRIDPETNRVSGTKIFTDRTPDAVVVGNDAVWLRTGDSVTRLSADNLRIEKTIPLRSEIIGLAAGRKTLWALLSDDEKYYLASINTKTNQVVARVPLAGEPSGLADDGGTLWVTIRKLGQLWKFNGTGNGEVFNLFSSADGIAAANGSIWVTDFVEGVLSRVDASTGRVVAPFNIGKDPGPFAVGAGAVWLLSYADWTITRIPV
jgi:streptogramin lyase